MNEQPIQPISHSRAPLPVRPVPLRIWATYVRDGIYNAFMFVQSPGGWREVHVSKTRTAVDWAGYVKCLLDRPRFASVRRISLACENFNTHAMGSLYAAFATEEACRFMSKPDLVHTPKHRGWLKMAELVISVMPRQCFSGRVSSQKVAERRITA